MNNITAKKFTVEERLLARVEKTDTCWLWQGGKAKNGYGYMSVQNKVRPVHRIAYETWNGEIPEAYDIDHTCFNRQCINPKHLRAATRKQNMEHLSGAYRNSKTGVRGVHYWEDRKTYVAELWHDSKKILVGYFKTLEEADAAVRAKRLELYTHDDANY